MRPLFLLIALPTLAAAQAPLVRERIVERDYAPAVAAPPPVVYLPAPRPVYEVPVIRVLPAPRLYVAAPVYVPAGPSVTYEYGPLGLRLRRVIVR